MDIVTQGLLGSTVAQAGFGRQLGRRAALYGFIVGLLPDFDVISGYWGQWASLKYHRGPTHAFLVLTLLAVPLGLLGHRLAGGNSKKRHWVGLTFLALITHPIIDWCTAYGTSLAWPFNNGRYAIDALPIIDPVYSLPLLVVTVFGLYGRGAANRLHALAVIALVATSIYAFAGWNTSQTLIERGSELFRARGFVPVEVRAMPTFLNTVVYRVVGRDAENRFMITYLKKSSVSPLTEVVTTEPDRNELVTRALDHENGRLFNWFAMNMLHTTSERLEDGRQRVVLHDMRYGLFLEPARTLFAAEAMFDREGQLISFSRVHNQGSISMKKEMAATLAHVFGDAKASSPAAPGDL
ncbi:MAG TPA: metal-dependent hydrolase [Candidatus Rifleibacterium sp.]|nr:metal-dependent hydrolase [Candidatus Rifleibacterium sp.]HPT45917.1 metal-dependent hydrolase [Candidatus Rifleibacterium sp.]